MHPFEELRDTAPGPKSTVLRPGERSLELAVRSIAFVEALRPFCVRPVSETQTEPVQVPPEPHWTSDQSWPVALVRAPGPGAVIELKVTLEGPGGFSGERWVQATSNHATLCVRPARVRFAGGGAAAMLALTGIPTSVASLPGLRLTWSSADAEHGVYAAFQETLHTLYFVNAQPCRPRPRLYADILRWSCEWAASQDTEQDIFEAIWRQFQPVQAEHPTGLQYWVGFPLAPDLDGVVAHWALRRRGVQCVGLAQLLMGCLAVHGMPSVQVTLRTDAAEGTDSFGRRYLRYEGRPYSLPQTWTCAVEQALGTAHSDPRVSTHTVAAVRVGDRWLLCDPSYGIGPAVLPARHISDLKAGPFDLPFEFVQALVRDFSCVPLAADGRPGGPAEPLKPSRGEPYPRLFGQAANTFE